jgi:hypothetical protein
MKKSLGIVVAVFALSAGCVVHTVDPGPGPGPAPVPTAGQITIQNQSDWDIHYLYMSSSSVDTWGPDQLGTQILYSGQSFTLTGIACDNYDLKFVDQDGDECTMMGVRLCGDNAVWNITNEELLTCEGYAD